MAKASIPIIPFGFNNRVLKITGSTEYYCIVCNQSYNYGRKTPVCSGGWFCGRDYYHFHHTCNWCNGEWIELSMMKEQKALYAMVDSIGRFIDPEKMIEYLQKKIIQSVTES